jgi:uncharacterized protein YprB with RNaseH-like and TPR domain
MTTTKRKRLYFDIETSPNIGFFWTAGFKLNISTESIIKERAIICICYKWEEDKVTHSLNWDNKQNDKKMLQEFIKVANEADELVGHNGDKFDLAWIRTRCLFHRIDMFPTYITIDTLKVARSKFKFNSNKLNYIAKYLGIGQKIHTDYDLWKDIVLNKDKDAMDKMIKYFKMDVILLDKVHKELSLHIPAKTHYGVIFGAYKGSCPECGSDDIVRNNKRVTASGVVKVQMRCNTCGKFHTITDK